MAGPKWQESFEFGATQETVGHLINRSKTFVTLAMDRNTEHAYFRHIFDIPMVNIVEMEIL